MQNSLGSLLATVGEFEAAKPLFSQVVERCERRVGPNDPSLAASVSNLAALLLRAGDYAGARRGYERALSLRNHEDGRKSNEYALGLEQLARLDIEEGRYDDARKRFDEVLEIRNRLYREPHERIAATHLRLAIFELRRGQPEEAARLYRRALDTLGEPHEITNYYYVYNVACYQALTGQREPALANLRRAVIDLGYTGAPLATDRNLGPLRGDPAIAEILAEAKRLIEQRGAPSSLGNDAQIAGG
jgi:tetratricopeptide (TPR) repeat protein